MKRQRDDDEYSGGRPFSQKRRKYNPAQDHGPYKNMGRYPSKNQKPMIYAPVPLTKPEMKLVDCYAASQPDVWVTNTDPNPIDVHSWNGSINVARNLFPGIPRGTGRSMRIGSKVLLKYISITGALHAVNPDGAGDIWKLALCQVFVNRKNTGASYGGDVYGSQGNGGGIGTAGSMPWYYWPRNEDRMRDFKVLKEWKLNTCTQGSFNFAGVTEPASGALLAKYATFQKKFTFAEGIPLVWDNQNVDGDPALMVENGFFVIARNTGRDGTENVHNLFLGIRCGFIDP